MPIGGGKMAFALECTPEAAVEKALDRAARIQMPGVDLDGAVWADPSGPRARVEP